MKTAALIYFSVIRFFLPVLAIVFIAIAFDLLLHNLKRKTLMRFAVDGYSNYINIKSTECIIGSGIMSDVRIKGDKNVEKSHAVLTLTDYGFKLTPMSEDSPVFVNNYRVEEEAYLQSGDTILVGSTAIKIAVNPQINTSAKQKSDKLAGKLRLCEAVILTLFEFFAVGALLLNDIKHYLPILVTFGGLAVFQWIYLAIRGFRTNVGVEIIAFFLTNIGFLVSASCGADLLIKKGAFVVGGVILFLLLSLLLNHLDLVEKLRIPVMTVGILLLALNIAFGTVTNGAMNWIVIGGVSFQPSEFVKVALVFISACSIEKMVKMKNLVSLLVFVFISLCALAYMRDFGSAAVYFVTLLIILCLRMCDLKIVLALAGGAMAASFVIINIFPYISARFATYRHAWEYASSGGYQQTRAMISIASGGLLGLGPTSGKLKYVSAADTDLVFGMVAEEMGLIVAVVTALCFVVLMIYAGICVTRTRSVYYAVTSAAAASIFIIQASLNIFGSVDLLPLTGVTLPFVSNGGSSMLVTWMLLAFIKQSGANFVTLTKKGGGDR